MMENMVIKFTYKVHTKIYSKIRPIINLFNDSQYHIFYYFILSSIVLLFEIIFTYHQHYCVDLIKVEHTQKKIKSHLMNKPQNLMTLIYFPVIKFNHTFMTCSYGAFSNMQ